ncbi:hypothetical protein BM536_030145 [Streptomyces phaeoluteigriseus]|uniref:DUF4190 domain-containing protein n=1 Tax=Streptomyces phaeoluteigriseus TaxID=114686 RepID=A0A1V6MJ37_9ACTN|nr:DUF4190 domain-containing protein [Streptomyces phaeoluteigriseus]OQD52459.1 hypothetical protein BM536_030145 [Streptomyces phaeoluteigriseus]
MSIPPPPGPQQPQDPYGPPQPQGPGPYPQQPYGPQAPQGPYPGAPYAGAPYAVWGQGYLPLNRPAPVNGVAIAALVLGVLCFLPAVGLVLGVIALLQIKKRGERGTGMAIGGAVLSSLGLALWVVMLATGGASSFWEGFKEGANGNSSLSLVKGDCFDVPGDSIDEDVYDVDTVDCAGEHEGEVFGTVRLSGGSYPGDAHVADEAEDKCYTLESRYTMDTWTLTDEIDVYHLTPTRESWEWGDRQIVCVFAHTDERSKLTGSLRSDATTLTADQLAFLEAVNALDDALYEEPEEYAEDDLDVNKAWAKDVADATAEQAEALNGRSWQSAARQPVADLVKTMGKAGKEWTAASTASDVDTFYEHYDTAYSYVDGDETVTAREALGLATTPPAYEDDSGGGSGGGGDGGLDV